MKTQVALSIAGIVRDRISGERISGALVQIIGGPELFHIEAAARKVSLPTTRRRRPFDSAISQSDGIFTFVDLPQGEYEVTAEADGFKAASARVIVEAGRSRYLLLTLQN